MYDDNCGNYVMTKAMLQGFADTGKSFALGFQRMFVKIIICDIYSKLTVATSGYAAANRGGDTS